MLGGARSQQQESKVNHFIAIQNRNIKTSNHRNGGN